MKKTLRLVHADDDANVCVQTLDLEALANRIRERVRNTTESIIGIGEDLEAAREHVGHGAFLGWIAREFRMSARTAQRYMCAAALAAGKYDTVTLLPPSTVYLLAARSTPEEIRADVFDAVKAGRPVDHRDIERRVRTARSEIAKTKKRKARRAARLGTKSPEEMEAVWQANAKAQAEAVSAAAEILERLPPEDLRQLRNIAERHDAFVIARALARLAGCEA